MELGAGNIVGRISNFSWLNASIAAECGHSLSGTKITFLCAKQCSAY